MTDKQGFAATVDWKEFWKWMKAQPKKLSGCSVVTYNGDTNCYMESPLIFVGDGNQTFSFTDPQNAAMWGKP